MTMQETVDGIHRTVRELNGLLTVAQMNHGLVVRIEATLTVDPDFKVQQLICQVGTPIRETPKGGPF